MRRGRQESILGWTVAAAVLMATSMRPQERKTGETAFRNNNHEVSAEADRGRGRLAERPSEIPAKGWKDIAWRTYANIGQHRILALAAGVTYYALLAIFPALAALVSVYGFFADPGTIATHLTALSSVLPGGAVQILHAQIDHLIQHRGSTLGLAAVIGLIVSLWSAGSGVKALIDALNVVYEEPEKRSFVRLNLTALAFTVGAIVFVFLALGAIVVIPIVLSFVGLEQQTGLILSYARWPALLVLVGLALALAYRFAPSRARPRWQWVTWGSALASIAWLAGSALFSWYAANFGNYDATYGSLGAAIGFLTWMWLSSIVILMGAQINAEIEHQTMRDSTEGPIKPLGSRHAAMADTVGASSRRVHAFASTCRQLLDRP